MKDKIKFEKLNNSLWKRIFICSICGIAILSVGVLATSKAKYKLTQSIKVGTGTVNYKVPDFKVLAMYKSEDGENYSEITEMPTGSYVINEDKTYCTTDNVTQVKGKIKTENGKHYISNLKKNEKCFLYFDKYNPPIDVDTILAGITVKETVPSFGTAATTDEGVFKVEDGMYGGESYYWRGAVTNNHVIFANICWRIVRINGDKSIRLIYNGTPTSGTCPGNGINSGSIATTSQAYNISYNRSEYVGYTYTQNNQRGTTTASNLKSVTETWFNSKITGTNLEKVADGYFCNDRNTASGSSWSSQPSSAFYYAGYDRRNGSPTLACTNASDKYTLKVGAITMDEIIMAGAKWQTANSSYYLYNGQDYWTMSPCYWWYYSSTSYQAEVFFVYNDGRLSDDWVNHTRGVRPVINLRSNVQFQSGGLGTSSAPFVVL